MKKRNLFAAFALAFITFGIYELYWSYKVRQGLIAKTGDEKSIPPFKFLLIPLFAALIALPFFLISATTVRNNILDLLASVASVVLVCSLFVSIFIYLWWYWHFFNTLYRVAKGNEATLSYVIWIISRIVGIPVWIILSQSDINKFITRTSANKHHSAPTSTTTAS